MKTKIEEPELIDRPLLLSEDFKKPLQFLRYQD
jgi:hypothetical protein